MQNKKLVYVAGPYGGNQNNLEKHIETVKGLIEVNKEAPYTFVSGMLMYNSLYNAVPYDEGLKLCLDLLDKCDYLLLLPGWKDSKGCIGEWGYALGCDEIRIWDTDAVDFHEDLVVDGDYYSYQAYPGDINLPETVIFSA